MYAQLEREREAAAFRGREYPADARHSTSRRGRPASRHGHRDLYRTARASTEPPSPRRVLPAETRKEQGENETRAFPTLRGEAATAPLLFGQGRRRAPRSFPRPGSRRPGRRCRVVPARSRCAGSPPSNSTPRRRRRARRAYKREKVTPVVTGLGRANRNSRNLRRFPATAGTHAPRRNPPQALQRQRIPGVRCFLAGVPAPREIQSREAECFGAASRRRADCLPPPPHASKARRSEERQRRSAGRRRARRESWTSQD